jgi:hypothetical protein
MNPQMPGQQPPQPPPQNRPGPPPGGPSEPPGPGGPEGRPGAKPRSKGGLEPLMEGRFFGENRLLVFSPKRLENILVAACLILGPIQSLLAWSGFFAAGPLALWWLGVAVFLAGCWAVLSAERLVCLLQEGTYVRKEARGLRITRGKLSELDALSVVAEDLGRLSGFGHTTAAAFRIVLHWKGGAHPPLVLAREDHRISSISELPVKAGGLVARASIYGRALGIPVYNGAQVFSPSPIRVV